MMRVCLFLAILPTLMAADSHAPIPKADIEQTPGAIMRQKLQGLAVGDMLELSKRFDPRTLDQLQNSPLAQEMMRRLREGDETFLKMAEQMARQHPEFKNYSSNQLRKMLQNATDQVLPPEAGDRPRADGDRPSNPLPRPDQRELAARRALNEKIGDMLKDLKLDNVAQELNGSPAFRDILTQMSKSSVQNTGQLNSQQLLGGLENLESIVGKLKDWMPRRMPKLNLSNVNLEMPAQNFSLRMPGGPSMPAMSGDGSMIPAALVAIVLGVVGWQLWRWRHSKSPELTALLYMEPIDPDSVSTREELIRAFEYAALVRCGPRAAHWHHRRVAERMAAAGALPDDVTLVRDLYERARYAPIPLADWALARPALKRLMGAAA